MILECHQLFITSAIVSTDKLRIKLIFDGQGAQHFLTSTVVVGVS